MENFLLHCLDAIELRETRFLVWGISDISLAEDELFDLILDLVEVAPEEVQERYYDPRRVVEDLISRSLVLQIFKNDVPHYRSRMAETVRLASQLRQLFPKHSGPIGWQQAPTLVADYRFLRRKRKFPNRDISPIEVLQACQPSASPTQQKILRHLLERDDSSLMLAGFQVRATERVLAGINKKEARGTIVCAGTGSGKTLSFYLPALTHIASQILQHSSKRWVKTLAIYPRNELLKDQFSEIYAESRRLDDVLVSQGKRKIQIGAFFGPTPKRAADVCKGYGWYRVAGGYACEYLRCPTNDCRGRLVWSQSNIESNVEGLQCDQCGHIINQDEIALTRARILAHPPDILFTTTEMLNQRLSDNQSRHIFGLGKVVKAPDLVLLDEVHTYVGTHGAQVSYVLRRWRSLVRSSVSFVGLSATLREAAPFFSTLTGLKEWNVAEVSPLADEVSADGAEYLLALRGDPVSRRSLLSTTIQATMLINRCLDKRGKQPSGGVYGAKTFVFTDDVDVTNRLYFNLLDAEGRDSWGRPDNMKHPGGALAGLRSTDMSSARYIHGQDWRLCERIGRQLREGLVVGRTSSQDPGVDLSADAIVATASLEVGFNDPEVGAVIQHKAPRDMAQFLQRKGRAGRSRKMRPWTVVSLSDYGRDRLAYQGYDLLFDPELPPRPLPISNRYIQRMQAVYALIDYLGVRLQTVSRGSVWQELSGPIRDRARKNLLENELTSLLESSEAQADLADNLKRLLQLDDETILSLLWEYPRPLFTTVIPTALRRIATNWSGGESAIFNSPLPEFTTANLFSDLSLPEVVIEIPPQQNVDHNRPAAMPILQAMRAFAPGRVSRRFGIAHQYVRHWIAPGYVKGMTHLSISLPEIAQIRSLGTCKYRDEDGEHEITVYRPNSFKTELPPKEVLDTSNAQHNWRTDIVPPELTMLEIPRNSGWEALIPEIGFALHNHHSSVEMRRFSLGSEANIAFKSGESEKVSFSFSLADESVALGFSLSVDAVTFQVSVPKCLWKDPEGHKSEKWQALRTVRYFDMAWRGEDLASIDNPFAREWVARVYLSALIFEALDRGISLEDASSLMGKEGAALRLGEVLSTIFQSTVSDDDSPEAEDRLRQEILDHLHRAEVREELATLAATLWEPINLSWQTWLKGCFLSTLAAVLFQAIENLCPDLNTEDLIVDIQEDVACGETVCDRIWISETTTGGSGLIEEVIERYGEDPRRYFNLVESALGRSEHEIIDLQLSRFLGLLEHDTVIKSAVDAIRGAGSLQETEASFNELRSQLGVEGFLQFHSFIVALNNRVLRFGSSPKVDELLRQVISVWRNEEDRLGIEIDARILAYLMSRRLDVESFLEMDLGEISSANLPLWRFNALYGVLWPRGAAVRQAHLNLYNPFKSFAPVERMLVQDLLEKKRPVVEVPCEDWREKCHHELQSGGALSIICRNKDVAFLKEVFNFLMTNPVEDDYLLLFPRLHSIKQQNEYVEIEVELAETVQ